VTNRSIILGARAKGDWTRALYHYAFTEQGRIACENGDKVEAVRVPVHVMIDGPYGGCSLDLGEFENVLLSLAEQARRLRSGYWMILLGESCGTNVGVVSPRGASNLPGPSDLLVSTW